MINNKIISVISLIKNEHLYLDEWLTHYINLGVDKIFIIEDITSESHKDICNKYDKVTLIKLSDFTDLSLYPNNINRQDIIIRNLYDFCIDKTDYIMFLDTDEFLMFNNNYSFDKLIIDMEYKNIQSVCLYWKLFTYSGYIYKPYDGIYSVVDTYTDMYNFYDDLNYHFKKETWGTYKFLLNLKNVNPDDLYNDLPTHMTIHNNIYIDFEYSKQLYIQQKVQLNHYITKSFEENIVKIYGRGDVVKNSNAGNGRSFNGFYFDNKFLKPYILSWEEFYDPYFKSNAYDKFVEENIDKIKDLADKYHIDYTKLLLQ